MRPHEGGSHSPVQPRYSAVGWVPIGRTAHLSKQDPRLYHRERPVDAETHTVLFNAAPLLTVTPRPLPVVGLTLASFLRRDRGSAAKDRPTEREPMGTGL